MPSNPKRGIINRKKVTTSQLNRAPWDGIPLGEAAPGYDPAPKTAGNVGGPERRNGPLKSGNLSLAGLPNSSLSQWSHNDWNSLNYRLEKRAMLKKKKK